MFFSQQFFAEAPWELRKDTDGIKVYTRKVENSSILQFRSTMTLDVPRDRVVLFYEDESRYTEWFSQCESVRVLETKSENEKILYYVMNMPWPVSDRDSVYKRVKSVETGGDVVFRLSALPDAYPRQPGKVRVTYLQIEWRFKSLSAEKTEISFQQHSSSDGHIPSAIVNKVSVNMPFKTFKKMKEILLKGES